MTIAGALDLARNCVYGAGRSRVARGQTSRAWPRARPTSWSSGGLGDTLETASAIVTALAALRVPTLFIPGGADRLELVDAAFEELDGQAAEFMLHGVACANCGSTGALCGAARSRPGPLRARRYVVAATSRPTWITWRMSSEPPRARGPGC